MSESISDSFTKRVDLRVAKITEVNRHPDADKLYIETILLGDEERIIVSGLVPYYSAEDLTGKNIILVANLKPAKLRGVESNGMLLAAEADGVVEVITVPRARPGDRIVLEDFKGPEAELPQIISIDEFFEIPIQVKNHHLFVDNKKLLSKAGPVSTVIVKDGMVR